MVAVAIWISASGATVAVACWRASTRTWRACAGFIGTAGFVTTSATVTSHTGAFGSTRITRVDRFLTAPALTARSALSTSRTFSLSASGPRAIAVSARATVTLSAVRAYLARTSGLVAAGTVSADVTLTAAGSITYYTNATGFITAFTIAANRTLIAFVAYLSGTSAGLRTWSTITCLAYAAVFTMRTFLAEAGITALAIITACSGSGT